MHLVAKIKFMQFEMNYDIFRSKIIWERDIKKLSFINKHRGYAS
ncbi:hypothetical protein DFP94_11410 [Fontibacillus phaseoli]|uniref:Uncharacterized protein n=1 Tax=Fontibacillus phaseoli TaxID=1416533 RepID=A0A369B292_9BACL|nr:hypothetical protein DFP94_11410 [Fontibacillus phaseoli]